MWALLISGMVSCCDNFRSKKSSHTTLAEEYSSRTKTDFEIVCALFIDGANVNDSTPGGVFTTVAVEFYNVAKRAKYVG
jgi:hypothetical protein